MFAVEDLRGVLLAHDQGLEGLAVLGFIGLESITVHLRNNGYLGGNHLLPGDAHVTHLGGGRYAADVKHIGILVYVVKGILFLDAADAVVEVLEDALVNGQLDRLPGRNAVREGRVKLVGAEGDILGPLRLGIHRGEDHIFVLVLGVLELGGLNRGRNPLLGIGVSGGGDFLAAQFVFRLGLGMFYPLVVLYGTLQGDGRGTKTEAGVHQRILRGGQSGGVNQFAVQCRVNLGGVLHLYIGALGLVEHFGGLDGAAFVPPEQYRGGDEENDAASDSLERVSYPRSIGSCFYFLVSHSL